MSESGAYKKAVDLPARNVVALVKEDAIIDAATLDQMPFNGMTVGVNFGNVYAMVAALCDVLDGVLEREEEHNER